MVSSFALTATLLLATCSADDPQTAAVPPPEIPEGAADLTERDLVTVAVTDNRFTERVIVVTAGTEVVFVNEGANDHNVKPAEEGAFREIETEELRDSGNGAIRFEQVGDFGYYCSIHGTPTRGQTGRVLVMPAG